MPETKQTDPLDPEAATFADEMKIDPLLEGVPSPEAKTSRPPVTPVLLPPVQASNACLRSPGTSATSRT